MKFTYSSGQRPLDGYTLKRGIGRGGFGEVYYGLSDGGKEVALKLVRGNLDVELRGMAQCLNFKHPNLVSLFDMRTDSQGDHWVVMEYVAGESLNAVISRHPKGLPLELVQPWFLAMASAIAYLHDHGVVHRDLKPANIFLENGLVKVGDYGLSKFMSSSRGSAQTQSVGTVHYMAPEISTGNYNKQIDIYAAGIILFEMLTGRVPFDGESAGEILMKHLTSAPDLSSVPAPYLPIVDKALQKNPVHRFPTMAEMARAVERIGAESQPIPVSAPVGEDSPPPARAASPLPVILLPEPSQPISPRARVAELCGSLALATVLAALFSVFATAVFGHSDITEIGIIFFLTVACSWAVLLCARLWPVPEDDSWARRTCMLLLGLGVGVQALWLDGRPLSSLLGQNDLAAEAAESDGNSYRGGPWGGENGRRGFRPLFSHQPIPVAARYLSYFGLAFFALRWWKMTDRRRGQRFSLFPLLAAGFWAFLLWSIWPWHELPRGILALVMTSAIVQLVSPWDQPLPPRAKRVRLRYA
jgi:hypothetical protein